MKHSLCGFTNVGATLPSSGMLLSRSLPCEIPTHRVALEGDPLRSPKEGRPGARGGWDG